MTLFRWFKGRTPVAADRARRERLFNGDAPESGMYAVVAVLLTTLLLGVSALAVDLANARMIRTQAQNTVDAAVLAAAQDLPDTVKVLATVKAYALDNFKLPASAWAGCVDDGALANRIDTDTTNGCITTNSATNPSKLRVRLPNTKMKTSFGRTLGVENLKIRASAEAELLLGRNDRVFPTGISGASGTGLECMEAGGSGACPNNHTGNFGAINSPRLNIHRPSAPTPQARKEDLAKLNYALGIDHSLVTDAVSPKVCDGGSLPLPAPCTQTNSTDSSQAANHLFFVHGNPSALATEGLITGAVCAANGCRNNEGISTVDDGRVPYCGRLARPTRTADNLSQLVPTGGCVASAPTITRAGKVINGHHVYMWMTPGARAYFYPEVPVTATGPALDDPLYVKGDVRLDCFLTAYTPTFSPTTCRPPTQPPVLPLPVASIPGAPIFLSGMVADPRYGTVPTICEIDNDAVCGGFPNGNGLAAIKDFKGSFLYTLNMSTNGDQVNSFKGWIFELSLVQPNTDLVSSVSSPVVRLSK